MEPLDKEASFRLIKNHFAKDDNITVVAPYFGKGACNSLGLNPNSKNLIIYCDLFSGACNPHEIAKLFTPDIDLRTVDNLHAKIYLTDSFVLLGSANPSSNGLGFEAEEVSGLIEACVAFTAPDIISKWKVFINERIRTVSRPIASRDLSVAKELWEFRQKTRKRAWAATAFQPAPWTNLMDIVNCSRIPEDIFKNGVYLCPATAGSYTHKRCKYFGMYRNKKVELVAEIEAVVDVNLDQGETNIKWVNVPALNIAKRAERAVARLRPKAGATRVFLLGEACPTSFEKDQPGPMRMSKRYADISISGATSASELAFFLAGKKWGEMSM